MCLILLGGMRFRKLNKRKIGSACWVWHNATCKANRQEEFMERFVFHMERFAAGHGAFSFLHGAIFHPAWSGRPFNRLVSEMHRLDSQSDRLVFQIDRRDFPLGRRPNGDLFPTIVAAPMSSTALPYITGNIPVNLFSNKNIGFW